jgi:hypothetical protein
MRLMLSAAFVGAPPGVGRDAAGLAAIEAAAGGADVDGGGDAGQRISRVQGESEYVAARGDGRLASGNAR